MAQFDIYANPSPNNEGFPYVVDMQNNQLASLPTRFVMPLQRLARQPAGLPRRLVQSVDVGGERFYMAVQQCAAVPARSLKKAVGSVAGRSADFADALDAVISGV